MGQDVTLSFNEVGSRLRLAPPLLKAILTSGLLGYQQGNRIPIVAVEHFERYGVQWRPELGRRLLDVSILGTPINGSVQPPSTLTQVQVLPQSGDLISSDQDEGWLAYFFLRTNDFYFPDPGTIGLTQPIGLRLAGPREVSGAVKPTYLYPDPGGNLAAVMVMGQKGSGTAQEAFNVAYNVASPVLDELAFRYEHPLPIAHSMIVGVPSGVITLNLPKPQIVKNIASFSSKCEFDELIDATALFREGISTNNPFHQFLALWKSYENATAVRGDWRASRKRKRSDARSDIVLVEERFPNIYAFKGFEGLSFGEARERLRASHRNAVAHGTLEGGRPRTAATAENYVEVAGAVPILRYMAHATLTNVRACLAYDNDRHLRSSIATAVRR